MQHPSNDTETWYKQLSGGQSKTFSAKDVIVAPGSQENRVFVVEQGRARICLFGEAREQTLGYLKPGSVYVTHSPAWVEAMEQTTIQSWPLQKVVALFAANPQIPIAAIREVGSLLNNAIDLIESLAFRSVESRLAHYLITETKQQASMTVRLIGNTEILASLLGTSRQTTSTILNKFEKSGLIKRQDREHLTVLNLSELDTLSAS